MNPLPATFRSDRAARYHDELRSLPASGGGGCHVALLRVANYGRLAGASPGQVAHDLV